MLTWLAIASGYFCFLMTTVRSNDIVRRASKALAYTLLMLVAGLDISSSSPAVLLYSIAVVLGLALSLLSDLLLMRRTPSFFLIFVVLSLAHTSYALAFWCQVSADMVLWWPVLVFALGTLTFLLILPNLGTLMSVVALYLLALSHMVWAAGEFWFTTLSMSGGLAFSGAMLLLFSDALFAIILRKRSHNTLSNILFLSLNYLAHALIVGSLITQ